MFVFRSTQSLKLTQARNQEIQSASSGVMPIRRHSGGVGGVSPPPAPRSVEATSLSDLIAGLADLDPNGLRLRWRNHLGGTPPAHLPRWLLLRVLAYQVQAAALGDLDKATLRVIRQPKGQTPDSALSRSRPAAHSMTALSKINYLEPSTWERNPPKKAYSWRV